MRWPGPGQPRPVPDLRRVSRPGREAQPGGLPGRSSRARTWTVAGKGAFTDGHRAWAASGGLSAIAIPAGRKPDPLVMHWRARTVGKAPRPERPRVGQWAAARLDPVLTPRAYSCESQRVRPRPGGCRGCGAVRRTSFIPPGKLKPRYWTDHKVPGHCSRNVHKCVRNVSDQIRSPGMFGLPPGDDFACAGRDSQDCLITFA